MSIAGVNNSFRVNLSAQQAQAGTQVQQTSGSGATAALGAAATLELSGASPASGGTSSASGSSDSTQCVLGKPVCTGCGQCGKTLSQTAGAGQNQNGMSALMQTGTGNTQNYEMINAITAYDKASLFA